MRDVSRCENLSRSAGQVRMCGTGLLSGHVPHAAAENKTCPDLSGAVRISPVPLSTPLKGDRGPVTIPRILA